MEERHTEYENQLGPKSKEARSFLPARHSIELAQKYLIYLRRLANKLRQCKWIRRTVKKHGHFSVITNADREPKKFLVALSYLSYPPFVMLLEEAEREFGYEQQGVLTLPCEASVLEKILSHEEILPPYQVCRHPKVG